MRLGHLGVCALFGLLALGPAQAAPLETYGQLPNIDNLSLSPDGEKLAYVTTVDGRRVVVIRSLADGKFLAGIKTKEQKLRDLTWADNDHLLTTLSITHAARGVEGPRREYFMTESFSLTDHEPKALLDNVADSMNVMLGAPERRIIDGHTVVFLEGYTFVDNKGVLALFKVDLESGHTEIVERGNKRTEDWYLDEHGNVVATSEYDESEHQWALLVPDGRSWKQVFATTTAIETPYVLGIGPDGTSLVFMLRDNGQIVQKQLSLSDGSWLPPLALGDDMDSVVTDPVSRRIIGTEQMATGVEYVFFDGHEQALWSSLRRAFPDENVELVSWSDDRRKVVVRVDGARDGAFYFLVDQNTHKAIPLGAVYKGISADDVATVRLTTYKAADGRTIPAYLTLPNGRPAKNLPLVVLPHGGPAVRDTPEFDWWAQALASRGYAVLQPEFRGSDGFGWNHLAAGFGQWGRKMQSDLSDGVRALAADGTIDPKRVCIAGASYGGYAAMAGATLETGVYRCAVAVSGIADPHDFLEWRSRRERTDESRDLRYWSRFMGAEDMDDPKLTEISPLAHAANEVIPILLIHGKDDTVVPIEQSEEMERALRRAGKPVTLLELDGEDHWLSRSETRLQMLNAMVQFLETNNPPN